MKEDRRQQALDESAAQDRLTPEGSDPKANASYKNIMSRDDRWARTDSEWKSVVAVALIAVLCVGRTMLVIVLDRGWDGLLDLLGISYN